MKINFLIISLLALTFLLFNCKKTTSTPNDGSDNNGDSNNTGSIPVLSSGNAISITSHSAKSGGKITSDGGKNIIAKGICWDLSPSPTITKNKTVDGSGTDEFTSQMNDLEYNTTYYVRSYATNSVGTAYGNEISFTTLFPFKFGAPQFIDTYYSGIDFGYNSVYIPSSGVIYNRYSSSWQINKAPKVFSDPVFTFTDIPLIPIELKKQNTTDPLLSIIKMKIFMQSSEAIYM